MTLTEIGYGATMFVALGLLRFGVPMLLTWVISKAAYGLEHITA